MGKGDRKTKRGKVSNGSFGKYRVKKSEQRKKKREANKNAS